ncbi:MULTISPECIES: MlaD family protein [Mycolicibacter]|uniref:MCE family protein n=1 Tax=[Mycobacterium] vasticus TaxID=2875777 RepID=A0ABU5YZM1_9MYCO|nr:MULTISPECIES: MCE family protein [unclassified Mycolicibacter]MEB3062150.1 MCE family protein [Mycolicibacter sp. MYC101]MEB3070355.1 MCE family protein [Mycolicibacter sp. MYC017]
MPNSFDTDPRGPSNLRVFVLGVVFIIVAVAIATLMVAKSQGRLDNLVRVNVRLTNIGDGLPPRSDVKYHELLVGSVSDITPSTHGLPNEVHIVLKPEHAVNIPDTVTARVVPANLFAVSAIQLVDNGIARDHLRSGAVVLEDESLPTVLFQNVLNKLRQLISPLGRKPDDTTVGVIAALGTATHGRGQELTDTGHNLNEILAQLNSVVAEDDAGPTTLSALTAAAEGLQQASPELFDALDRSIRPMATIAEKGPQLSSLLAGGTDTATTLAGALENQSERMITITSQFTPALGVIADHADEFHGVSTKLQTLADRIYDIIWDPNENLLQVKAAIALTPSRTYVRADCPRYGELAGPSCATAPEVPTAPDLFPALESQGVSPTPGMTENRPNVTPPRHSMPGDPQGPPIPPPPGPPAEVPAAEPQGAVAGGNVGLVGSPQEKQQISLIAGSADTPTVLLLAPLLRGSTVHLSQTAKEGGR